MIILCGTERDKFLPYQNLAEQPESPELDALGKIDKRVKEKAKIFSSDRVAVLKHSTTLYFTWR